MSKDMHGNVTLYVCHTKLPGGGGTFRFAKTREEAFNKCFETLKLATS